jgi:ELWxxDGT repeat protein
MDRKLFASALTLAFLVLTAGTAGALTPRLVKDINPVPVPGSSEPETVASLSNGISLFVADDGLTGRALWRTDGTAAGTYRLTEPCGEICDVYNFQFATVGERSFFVTLREADFGFVNQLWVTGGSQDDTFLLADDLLVPTGKPVWLQERGLLYFVASDVDHGYEVWRSDGTAAGTWRVTDIVPGPRDAFPRELTAFQGKVFFQANNRTHGQALWATDGTAAGTRMVRDPWPGQVAHAGPTLLRVVGNRLLFFAQGRSIGYELWASDGTARGTQPVADLVPGPDGLQVFSAVVALGRYFFVAKAGRGEELWVSDGTRAGTGVLSDFPNAWAFNVGQSSLSGLTVAGKMVFMANDGSHGNEPWITDGTRAGTRLLRDLCPGECPSNPIFEINHGGRLYFLANDGVRGMELWSTDGTAAGTRLIRDLCHGACSGFPHFFRVVRGRLLFAAWGPTAESRPQIWRTNGTPAGTVRVSAFENGLSLTAVGTVSGAIVFPAFDREHGIELWRSDGTRAGTRLVADIDQVDDGGSSPRSFRVLGDSRVAFFADAPAADGTVRPGVWRSDGTAAGTVPHRELPPCTSGHEHIAALPDDDLVFICTQGSESFLQNATEAGPVRLTSSEVFVTASPDVAVSGGRLFFAATHPDPGTEPWVSDGTPQGTRLLDDLDPIGSSNPAMFTAFAGRVWFTAYSVADESGGRELWVTDGTETVQVTRVGGGADPEILGIHAGRLWFAATDPEHGRELWSTDGTVEGTGLMADVLPNGSFAPTRLVSAGDRMFLSAGQYPETGGLWVSDGTAAGTHRLSPYSIVQDFFFARPRAAVVGGRLFYVTFVDGQETLWQSDGTEAGTGPVVPGAAPLFFQSPQSLISFDGVLLFLNKGDLWRSDGTAAGTVPVEGVDDPGEPVLAGSRVFLRASDPVHGTELWALDQ